jgi:hypothetical protein
VKLLAISVHLVPKLSIRLSKAKSASLVHFALTFADFVLLFSYCERNTYLGIGSWELFVFLVVELLIVFFYTRFQEKIIMSLEMID